MRYIVHLLESDGKILVAGGGGFIGGHLISRLISEGFKDIRAADIKPIQQWSQLHQEVESVTTDLSKLESAMAVMKDVSYVFNLAADMGGMGFIETHKAECMLSVLINTHLLQAAKKVKVEKYFFSSSACVYNADKQASPHVIPLRESEAYPALPEDGYGWEKLFSERMCRHFEEDFGLAVRVARYHNIYGPLGTWDGGREKAPAAICRKVAFAKLLGNDEIEIWGDGNQTRSFTFIDDCIEGTLRIFDGPFSTPFNVGSSELVTIDQLVDIVEEIAGTNLRRKYVLDAPRGVSGRNSDNSLIKQHMGWEPTISLRRGMEITFSWIYDQIQRRT